MRHYHLAAGLHILHFTTSFLEGLVVGVVVVLFFIHGKGKG